MAAFYQSYCKKVKADWNYFACWLPVQSYQVGDYGVLNGKEFNRVGNIAQLGIVEDIKTVPANNILLASADASVITADGKGNVKSQKNETKSSVTIQLANQSSFYANLTSNAISRYDNLTNVGEAVLKMREYQRWQDNWYVIIELLTTEKCLMYIASEANSTVELSIGAPKAGDFLRDLNANFSVSTSKQIGFQEDGLHKMTPFFKLGRVKRGFLGVKPPSFNPLAEQSGLKQVKQDDFYLFDDDTMEIP